MDVSQSESGNLVDSLQLTGGECIQRERDRSRESVRSLLNFKRNFASKMEAMRHIGEFIKSIFLPVGFPFSVPPEYFRFQCWNLLQDSCSYLRGIMSTQAILLGMGVGRSDVTAVQATIQVCMYRSFYSYSYYDYMYSIVPIYI